MRPLIRRMKYALWVMHGHLGRNVALDLPQQVTVLITYYNPVRMGHGETQVRNLLRCRFVEQIVLSNHNPAIQLEERIKVRDPRVTFLNQPEQRGCGYRWLVAREIKAPYLIVIDDDVLLYPAQLTRLFQHLVRTPTVPHGFTGMRVQPGDQFEYCEYKEAAVDYLCEIYAVTHEQVARYLQLRATLAVEPTLAQMIDTAVDFMLISQCGNGKPQIHNAGRLLRCPTFQQPAVAIHKRQDFTQNMRVVNQALAQYQPTTPLRATAIAA